MSGAEFFAAVAILTDAIVDGLLLGSAEELKDEGTEKLGREGEHERRRRHMLQRLHVGRRSLELFSVGEPPPRVVLVAFTSQVPHTLHT